MGVTSQSLRELARDPIIHTEAESNFGRAELAGELAIACNNFHQLSIQYQRDRIAQRPSPYDTFFSLTPETQGCVLHVRHGETEVKRKLLAQHGDNMASHLISGHHETGLSDRGVLEAIWLGNGLRRVPNGVRQVIIASGADRAIRTVRIASEIADITDVRCTDNLTERYFGVPFVDEDGVRVVLRNDPRERVSVAQRIALETRRLGQKNLPLGERTEGTDEFYERIASARVNETMKVLSSIIPADAKGLEIVEYLQNLQLINITHNGVLKHLILHRTRNQTLPNGVPYRLSWGEELIDLVYDAKFLLERHYDYLDATTKASIRDLSTFINRLCISLIV